jgi:hypothetical protein
VEAAANVRRRDEGLKEIISRVKEEVNHLLLSEMVFPIPFSWKTMQNR